MTVLVAGSLPPPDSGRGIALVHAVTTLLSEGHEVETLALEPVATAHGYLGPGGLPACLRLARRAPRYEAVVIQLEPGLPVRTKAGRVERALSLLALSIVLRRARDTTIRLNQVEDLPGGLGGRGALEVWRRADRVVVGDSRALEALLAAAPSLGERTTVAPAPLPSAPGDGGDWGDGADASAENVLALVRARAAAERRSLAADNGLRVAGWDRLPAPGAGLIEIDASASRAIRQPGLGGLARAALAIADRRPYLRPVAATIRATRRAARSALAERA